MMRRLQLTSINNVSVSSSDPQSDRFLAQVSREAVDTDSESECISRGPRWKDRRLTSVSRGWCVSQRETQCCPCLLWCSANFVKTCKRKSAALELNLHPQPRWPASSWKSAWEFQAKQTHQYSKQPTNWAVRRKPSWRPPAEIMSNSTSQTWMRWYGSAGAIQLTRAWTTNSALVFYLL